MADHGEDAMDTDNDERMEVEDSHFDNGEEDRGLLSHIQSVASGHYPGEEESPNAGREREDARMRDVVYETAVVEREINRRRPRDEIEDLLTEFPRARRQRLRVEDEPYDRVRQREEEEEDERAARRLRVESPEEGDDETLDEMRQRLDEERRFLDEERHRELVDSWITGRDETPEEERREAEENRAALDSLIYPERLYDKSAAFASRLEVHTPAFARHVPWDREPLSIFRVAGQQATNVGVLFDHRVTPVMGGTEMADLVRDTSRASVVVPLHGGITTLDALRNYIIHMPVGETLTATITDANIDQLYTTFRAFGDYVFMINAQLMQTAVYPHLGRDGSNTYARYVYAAGIADDIFDPTENFDDVVYGNLPGETGENGEFSSDVVYATTSIRLPMYIQKFPRRLILPQSYPRIIRAGGFEHVCLPEHTYIYGDFSVYFPSCVPSDPRNCLVYCVWKALLPHMGEECSPRAFEALWEQLMLHRSRRGDYTTHCINALNGSLRELSPLLGFTCAVYLYHRESKTSNAFKWSNQQSVEEVWSGGQQVDVPVRVSRINYYGEFTTKRGVKKVEGGTHYVLLDRMGVTLEGLTVIEEAMREHIARKWDVPFEELYEMNKKMMEEKDEEVRKKMRQRQTQEASLPRRTKDLRVAVWDLECLVERQEGDEMDCTAEELKRIHADEALHHVPCMFSWGVVNLEISLAERWEEMYKSRMPSMEAMTDEEVEKLTAAAFYMLESENRVEVIVGDETRDFRDTIRRGVEGMFVYMRRHGLKELVAVAHNASSYDNFLAAKNYHPINAFGSSHIKIVDEGYLQTGRGILKLTFKCEEMTLMMQCTKVHFGASLEKLGESFKIPPSIRKKAWDFEVDFITRTRLRNPQFLENLRVYAAYDIYSLGVLVCFFEQFHRQIFPITDKTVLPRIAACTYQSFLRKWLRETRLFRTYIPNQIPLYDDTLLKALRGGISLAPTREYITNIWMRAVHSDIAAAVERSPDHFQWIPAFAAARAAAGLPELLPQDVVHEYPELWQCLLEAVYKDPSSLISLDCNSLYPYAMTHPVPRGPGQFLNGEDSTLLLQTLVNVDHPREWGIVCVTIYPDSFPADCFPFFSTRREKGLGLRYCRPEEPITTYFTSLDLITYSWAGATMEIHHGVWWLDDNDLSTEYISVLEELFARRNAAPDDLQKGVFKNASVSTFGCTGNKVTPVKDVVLQLDKELNPDELVVAKVQRAAYLPSCTIVRLKAHFTHVYNKLSTKSTITSNVLSRARYHILRCVRAVGMQHWTDVAPEEAFRRMLREVHYTDTDSLFVQQKWEAEFDKCGFISARLGDFKNDYNGVIPQFFAGAPKNRQTEIVYYDEKAPGGPLYRLRLVSKFKGMPMKRRMEHACVQRDVFLGINTQYSCSMDKTVWKRSLAGVNTQQCPYEVTPQSLMKDKRGVLGEVDDLGNIRVRNVQIGDMLPLTLEYPNLEEMPKEDRAQAVQQFLREYNEMRISLVNTALTER